VANTNTNSEADREWPETVIVCGGMLREESMPSGGGTVTIAIRLSQKASEHWLADFHEIAKLNPRLQRWCIGVNESKAIGKAIAAEARHISDAFQELQLAVSHTNERYASERSKALAALARQAQADAQANNELDVGARAINSVIEGRP
jgi:RNA 3'-terminal phosphate cyclase